jgi:hypothetical protein
MEKIGRMSPWIAQYFPEFEFQCSIRMKYLNNLSRVWFTKGDLRSPSGHPLAEAAISKDKWQCQIPIRCDGCHAVALNAAELPGGENLRGGKRLRLRCRKGCLVQHTYPLTLSRGLIRYRHRSRSSKRAHLYTHYSCALLIKLLPRSCARLESCKGVNWPFCQ